MKNSWLIWVFIIGVVITVFFAFNQQNNVPFNDIFPEDEMGPEDIEFEFISKEHNDKVVETPQVNAVVENVSVVVPESISSVRAERDDQPGTGISPVAEKPIEPKDVIVQKEVKVPEIQTPQVDPSSFKFTVQIASFKKKSLADKMVEELAGKKYKGFIMSKDLKEAGVWYRVYVGQFNSKKEAEAMLETIKKDYKGSFIISSK